MPPASQFLKHSKTKMQAWVTNSSNQAVPTASGPGPGHDNQNYHTHLIQPRQVNLSQHAPLVAQPAQTTQAPPTSPPRSREPIIKANSNRAAAVMAARLPVPASRTGHARDTSLNMSRSKTVASEPIQSSRRVAPFWEGSTVDGSMFSESGSNADANSAATSMYRMPFRQPPYQHRGATPRPRPYAKEESNIPDQHAPFIIGPNGIIDVVGGGPLTRSASTPDARSHQGRLKVVSSPEPEPDQDSDSPYQTSPEKTPSAKRLPHPKVLPVRPSRRGSYSERIAYPQGENNMSSPPRQPYQSSNNDLDDVRSERSLRLRMKTLSDPNRNTVFADTDTPVLSNHGESDVESVAPEPAPKPITKPKPQISRQLWPKTSSHGRPALHESAMPRQMLEKRLSNPKKRALELDYDDGALAAMDYSELKNEAFDFDPAQAEVQSAVGPPRGGLPERLHHFLDQDQPIQMEFFSKMPVKDWEASGDWFLEKFGEIMDRFRDARRTKRTMMEGFENEIAERGEAVRNKIQGIDVTLSDLKSEGEGMMVGKEFD
ncbi:extracellular mutant protein 11-domain-containing protein [Hypoxylon trugodes]|uniref:extracellular mutant protein 11-domain-containing protein n=1 Tax=Hypoxylon trugodes TaxID=326681 RepID=UPI0021A15EE2|nr:extracellular mutant protein 11-domain-containing protein [Hypoxylon trugodes]KAI1386468.1 extracellular mutant protein 11-domain-containing protein [Hypoxylon trugodes]